MLYAVVVWTILTLVCFILGNGVLNFFHANYFTRVGDRFILSIWLGIISLTVILLGLSFIVPLSTITGIVAFFIISILILLFSKNRKEISLIWSYLKPRYIGIYYLIAITVATVIIRPMIWFDTGLYHWHSIKWLSNFGTVTGLALINSKHGFNAGWFAFSAPLHIPQLGSHVGAISNGFIFFIAIVHFLIAIKYLLNNKNQIFDWFISIYYLIICSVYIITIFTGSPILISYSPDIPVNFFVGIIAWTILLILNINSKSHDDQGILSVEVIPLFLALGTVTMKLTALPLLMVTLFFAIYNSHQKIKTLILSCILSILMLLPMFSYSIKTTGCLLYPSSFACFEVPWAISNNIVKKETQTIRGIKEITPKQNYFLVMVKKRWKWLKSSSKLKIIVLLFTISIILSTVIIKNKKSQDIKRKLWLIILAFIGMLFIILQIPLLRFGLGYFIIVFCLFFSMIIHNNYQKISRSIYLNLLKQKKIYSSIVILFSIIIISKNFKIKKLLIPPLVPTVKPIQTQINDVKYIYPDNWTAQCWDAQLPCSPVPIKGNFQLKDAKKGISGGFINQNKKE